MEKSIFEQVWDAASTGVKWHISLKDRTLTINGKKLVDNGKYEWQKGYEPCVSATIGGILQYVNVGRIWVNYENIVMLNVVPSDDCMDYDIAITKLEMGQTIEIADDMVRYAVEDES